MKKIVFLLLISFGINAQTRIKYSQMENPATSSVNLGTQTFSVSTITGSVTIGTGTVAANTSSLGIVRIKQRSSWMDFGEYSSGVSAIWFNAATPTTSNYNIYNSSSFTAINHSTDVRLEIGASARVRLTSTGLRVGSASAPSATLDVTGTMSVSGTSTLNGAVESGGSISITSVGSNKRYNLTGTAGQSGYFGVDGTGFYMGSNTSTSSRIIINNGAFVPFTADVNGRVGINNTAPSASLDVIGTMNVSSTSTFTGVQNNGQLSMTGRLITTGSGSIQIASNTNQLGNLNLSSSSSATWTTGNTGTVAVLSDAVFDFGFTGTSYNPSDGATVYLGNHLVVTGASATGTVTIPYNCTLVGWNFNTYVGGTLGSAETATAVLNYNGSDYVMSTAITFTTLNSQFSGSGLSQNFTAGDRINFKLYHPTYVTNPTTLYHGVTFLFVRRQ